MRVWQGQSSCDTHPRAAPHTGKTAVVVVVFMVSNFAFKTCFSENNKIICKCSFKGDKITIDSREYSKTSLFWFEKGRDLTKYSVFQHDETSKLDSVYSAEVQAATKQTMT